MKKKLFIIWKYVFSLMIRLLYFFLWNSRFKFFINCEKIKNCTISKKISKCEKYFSKKKTFENFIVCQFFQFERVLIKIIAFNKIINSKIKQIIEQTDSIFIRDKNNKNNKNNKNDKKRNKTRKKIRVEKKMLLLIFFKIKLFENKMQFINIISINLKLWNLIIWNFFLFRNVFSAQKFQN